MTDQEIKNAILEVIDKHKFGHVNTVQLSKDWGEDEKRIRLLCDYLQDQGLVKSRFLTRKMPSVNNFVLTDKGRQYLGKSLKDG